ncbi:LCP family protein [Candidatus Oleimmundimicrobium sp.]|uniref:LCP family protein n=1 Tax=Candidatus Oleimmundimicrobium sp. TaxID=3060597 RepID=UPI00271D4292|nr:LCP family protein [Candidatus Oleimmundimicrobium sp.]MDO8886584.1 LCP family protein [Candidatus Oleimmundimicrobium sp.]
MGKHLRKRRQENTSDYGIVEYKKNSRHIIPKILLILFILFLASAAACYAYVKNLEQNMNSTNGNNGLEKILTESKNQEPVNILLLGNDTRGDDQGRADTIIVMRFNPQTKKVILISIPRDFRVKIPGHSYNKINAAYMLGGAELMINTVEEFTGIDMHHYVMVDFKGFKETVDVLGGVEVYVEKRMRDSSIKLSLNPGYHKLDGETALKYVRFRHDVLGDFGRIERQQKFIKAILSESMRIKSIFKVPELASIVAENTRSDMSISEMISLGKRLSVLKGDDLDGIMLPGTPEIRNGVSYVIPNEKEIDKIIYRVQNDLPLDGELPAEFIENDDITLDIRNGCESAGIAHKLADRLKVKDFQVKNIGNADKANYDKTLIIYGSNAKNKVDKVGAYLPFAKTLKDTGQYNFSTDILIIIGKDYIDNE